MKIMRPQKNQEGKGVADLSKVAGVRGLMLWVLSLSGGSLLVSCQSGVTANDLAKVEVLRARSKVMEYRMLAGEYPLMKDGLKALVKRPSSLVGFRKRRWTASYDEVPVDPWGNRLVYLVDDELFLGFGIYSCGPDGVSASKGNDPDDVNSWD